MMFQAYHVKIYEYKKVVDTTYHSAICGYLFLHIFSVFDQGMSIYQSKIKESPETHLENYLPTRNYTHTHIYTYIYICIYIRIAHFWSKIRISSYQTFKNDTERQYPEEQPYRHL